jgi:hypothetical protein
MTAQIFSLAPAGGEGWGEGVVPLGAHAAGFNIVVKNFRSNPCCNTPSPCPLPRKGRGNLFGTPS